MTSEREPTTSLTSLSNSTCSLGNCHKGESLSKRIVDRGDIKDSNNILVWASIIIPSSTLYIKPRAC
jgi:hypothetical protein